MLGTASSLSTRTADSPRIAEWHEIHTGSATRSFSVTVAAGHTIIDLHPNGDVTVYTGEPTDEEVASVVTEIDARDLAMLEVLEQALADKSTWSAAGLGARARMPTLELPAKMVLDLHREATRRNELEPGAQHTTRGLLEQIVNDALDRAGASP